MEFLYFLVGILIGAVFVVLYNKHINITGIIDVDHNTEQCRIKITSTELSNLAIKKAVFKINHNAKISQEEQTL